YDSFGHSITYDLYFSNNTGSNWYSLVSGLTNSSFYWNTSSFQEGSEYQVRIVASDTTSTTSTSETGTFSIDPQAPRLGIVPSSFTVELSWDPMPVLNFSAFDENPDWAYIEWLGFEMSEPVFWSNDTLEYLIFPEANVQYGVGVHPLYLVVYDISGNEARHLFYMTVVDTTAPTITILETNQTFELGPHGSILSWNPYDLAAGTYDAYFNDSLDMSDTWVSNTGTELNVDGYMPGVYNVTIVFYDSSGNNVSHSINMTIVDTTAPSITVFPADDTIEVGTSGHYLNWTLVELDPGTYNVTINSVFSEEISYSNGTVILDIDGFALGFYNITTIFYDNSGNLANDSVYITVSDTIAPVITSQTDVILEFGSIGNFVNWTATDVVPNNYTVYVDATYWTSGFWSNGTILSIPVDGLAVGNHTFQIHFADTTNNQDLAEIVIVVQDTIQPTWIETPENQVLELGASFYYNVNASDLSAISYSIDDGTNFAINSLTGEISNATNLAVGVYELQINATDNLGNVLSLTISVSVEDTVSPEISLFPDDIQFTTGTTGHSAIWIATDLDPGNYSVYIDGTLFTTDSWSSLVPIVIVVDGLSEGTHTVEIRFSDSSGNMITDSITVIVIPEITTPTTLTETITPPDEGTPMIILLIGGGVAAVAIVVLGILVLKKKTA
ncbi:MAG: hypothetical protein KAR33_04730, partial [Candidatus Thorarchaeota archaeon]|nr:hypothetical protein [Candidatus Thorarchaeota archaeon]